MDLIGTPLHAKRGPVFERHGFRFLHLYTAKDYQVGTVSEDENVVVRRFGYIKRHYRLTVHGVFYKRRFKTIDTALDLACKELRKLEKETKP